ncbi:unnamed protein product [Closterium sp. NIES-65]|nr:unnamed protein product [Closterium sp. NIES-65]
MLLPGKWGGRAARRLGGRAARLLCCSSEVGRLGSSVLGGAAVGRVAARRLGGQAAQLAGGSAARGCGRWAAGLQVAARPQVAAGPQMAAGAAGGNGAASGDGAIGGDGAVGGDGAAGSDGAIGGDGAAEGPKRGRKGGPDGAVARPEGAVAGPDGAVAGPDGAVAGPEGAPPARPRPPSRLFDRGPAARYCRGPRPPASAGLAALYYRGPGRLLARPPPLRYDRGASRLFDRGPAAYYRSGPAVLLARRPAAHLLPRPPPPATTAASQPTRLRPPPAQPRLRRPLRIGPAVHAVATTSLQQGPGGQGRGWSWTGAVAVGRRWRRRGVGVAAGLVAGVGGGVAAAAEDSSGGSQAVVVEAAAEVECGRRWRRWRRRRRRQWWWRGVELVGVVPSSVAAVVVGQRSQASAAAAALSGHPFASAASPVAVSLADPSGGPVLSHFSTVLPCPAAPSGTLSGLYLPSFSTNLVSGADLQDGGVHQFTPARQRVAASGQVLAAASPVRSLSLPPVLVASCLTRLSCGTTVLATPPCPVFGAWLPVSLSLVFPSLSLLSPPGQDLPVSPVSRVASGLLLTPPTSSPRRRLTLQTLHMDVWGPAPVRGQGYERYFLLVVDDYSRYTTVLPLRSKGAVTETFTLPDSPQQNGIAERRIGMVMDVAPLLSTGKVGDASVFRVWGSRAFVRDLSADKLSPRAAPCVFLGFPTDAPGWQFYHPSSRRVLSSQDVTFDESVPFYRLFPYRTPSLPPSPGLPCAGSPPGRPPSPSGSCPLSLGVLLLGVLGLRVLLRRVRSLGVLSRGVLCLGVRGLGVLGRELLRLEVLSWELLSLGVLRLELLSLGFLLLLRLAREPPLSTGAARVVSLAAGGVLLSLEVLLELELELLRPSWSAGAAGPGAAGPAGPPGAGAAEGAGAEPTAVGPATGGVGGAGAVAEGAGADPAASGAAARPRPYFVPLLQQVLGLSPPVEGPPPVQSQSLLEPSSPLPAPSLYTGPTGGLAERREPASRPASPVRAARASGRSSRQRPPPVPGTHRMSLRPSTAPLRAPWPSPPESSLPALADPESDSLRAASPTVTRLLATVVTDPSFESTAASALVAELVDFAARCRLDYTASLVAESASVCPPSVGGECALSTDVLEDRQEELQCLAAASPHLASVLLAPEGDSDALDIPTPRSYAEAVEGPYSSQWQAAMDAEMASWKSTGTYVDAVPPPGANIVSGMWIFRVKRPPGSPPVFKARYVARGFSQRQGVDYFQTFSPTPKMTTLRVLLHIAAQRGLRASLSRLQHCVLAG